MTKRGNIQERIASLEAEIERTQRNKSTEAHLGYLRQKLMKLRKLEAQAKDITPEAPPVSSPKHVTNKRIAPVYSRGVAAPHLGKLNSELRTLFLALGKESVATRTKTVAELSSTLSRLAKEDPGQVQEFCGIWCLSIQQVMTDPSEDVRRDGMAVTGILLPAMDEEQLHAIAPTLFVSRFDNCGPVSELSARLLKTIDMKPYRADTITFLEQCFRKYRVSPSKGADSGSLAGAEMSCLYRLCSNYDDFKNRCDFIIRQCEYALLPLIKSWDREANPNELAKLVQETKHVIKETMVNGSMNSQYNASVVTEGAVSAYYSYCVKVGVEEEISFIRGININILLKYFSLNHIIMENTVRLLLLCNTSCSHLLKRIYDSYVANPITMSLSADTIHKITKALVQQAKNSCYIIRNNIEMIKNNKLVVCDPQLFEAVTSNKEELRQLFEANADAAIQLAVAMYDPTHREEADAFLDLAIESISEPVDVNKQHLQYLQNISALANENIIRVMKCISHSSFDILFQLVDILQEGVVLQLYKADVLPSNALLCLKKILNTNVFTSHSFISDVATSLLDSTQSKMLLQSSLLSVFSQIQEHAVPNFCDKLIIELADHYKQTNMETDILVAQVMSECMSKLSQYEQKFEFLTPEIAISYSPLVKMVKALLKMRALPQLSFQMPQLVHWNLLGKLLDSAIIQGTEMNIIIPILLALTENENVCGGRELGGWTPIADADGDYITRDSHWLDIAKELCFPPFATDANIDEFSEMPQCRMGLIEALVILWLRLNNSKDRGFLPFGAESENMYPVKPFAMASLLQQRAQLADYQQSDIFTFICSDILETYSISTLDDIAYVICMNSTGRAVIEKMFEILDGACEGHFTEHIELLCYCLLSLLTANEYTLHKIAEDELPVATELWDAKTPLHVKYVRELTPAQVEFITRLGGQVPRTERIKCTKRGLLLLSIYSVFACSDDPSDSDDLNKLLYGLSALVFNKIGKYSGSFMSLVIKGFNVDCVIERALRYKQEYEQTEDPLTGLVYNALGKMVIILSPTLGNILEPKMVKPVNHLTKHLALSGNIELPTYAFDDFTNIMNNLVFQTAENIRQTPDTSGRRVQDPYKTIRYALFLGLTNTTVVTEEQLEEAIGVVTKCNNPLYLLITVMSYFVLHIIEIGGLIRVHDVDIPANSLLKGRDAKLRAKGMDVLLNKDKNLLYSLLALATKGDERKLRVADLLEYILRGADETNFGDLTGETLRECLLMSIPAKVQLERGLRRRTYPSIAKTLSPLVCFNIMRWVHIENKHADMMFARIMPRDTGVLLAQTVIDAVTSLLDSITVDGTITYDVSKSKHAYDIFIRVKYERVSYLTEFFVKLRYPISVVPTVPSVKITGELPKWLEKSKKWFCIAASRGSICYGACANVIIDIINLAGLQGGPGNKEEEVLCPICFSIVDPENKKNAVKCKYCTTVMHKACYREYKYSSLSNTCPICRQ